MAMCHGEQALAVGAGHAAVEINIAECVGRLIVFCAFPIQSLLPLVVVAFEDKKNIVFAALR